MTQSEQRRVLAEYVARLRSLCAEVSAATSALAGNDLNSFEGHLETLQSICGTSRAVPPPPEFSAPAEADAGSTDHEAALLRLKAELSDAQRELARANRVFAGVVNRSAVTVSWLSLLCQSAAEGYGERTTSAATPSRISCEV